MWRGAALVAAGALALAGCGEASSPAQRALKATEDRLDEIRSGNLSLTLLASAPDAPEGTGAGFQVEGVFAVGTKKGSLPLADLEFTRITGTELRSSRFVSTGSRAYIGIDGTFTELTGDQLSGLRVTKEGSGGGLEGLTLTRWLAGPTVAPGPAVEGVATEQVTGTPDPIAILNDVIGLSEQFGSAPEGVMRLEGDAADRVRRAVSGSQAEVITGQDDRLLRRARASVDLAVTDPKVREALGDLTGARLALTLEVTELNRPVEVGDP